MKKMYFFETEPWEKKYLEKHLKGVHPLFLTERLFGGNVKKYQDATLISTFINSKLSKDVLEKFPKLRFIAVRATGFDHVDIAEARKRHIVVSNVPSYGTTTVAEHTFALLLAVSRKIFQSYERTERLNFDFHGLTGFDLEGKILGLVGFGRIAKHVARIAGGFGMKVLAFDPQKDERVARVLGVKFVPIKTLFRLSDVVSFHTPYTEATHHLLNLQSVKKLKRGVIIINTARGPIIDTQTLLYGLEHKIISGAGLDVLEGEQALKEEKELLHGSHRLRDFMIHAENHALIKRDDVIITPHNAFNSKEAIERILATTVENIGGFLRGKPVNRV